MRVGILTQPLGKNYGGIIQNYALQQSLIKLGYEPITIQREHNVPNILKKNIRYLNRLKKRRAGLWGAPIVIEHYYNRIFANTNSFINDHISKTELIFSSRGLIEHLNTEKYLGIIVGSDQVWRPIYSPDINNYYLDFIENKSILKVSYAASFGVDFWEYSDSQTKKCSKLVSSFDAISVREKSAVTLCKNYLGVTATHVLDPTLLLCKDDYRKLFTETKGESEGVFTYWLDSTSDKLKFAELVADNMSCQVFTCYAKTSVSKPLSKNIDDYKLPALQDWLQSFHSASVVLTDSFHGMVFSIIFGKEFFIIGNKNRGAARFESLLGALGLKERLLSKPSDMIQAHKTIAPINYSEVYDKLSKLREDSLKFLRNSLEMQNKP